jgi:hypothetical protein
MKTCTYISGRYCVGKFTVATAIMGSLPEVSFISGREYWERYSDDLAFEDRLSKTNQDILDALQDANSSDILCEWVPCRSPFVAQMYDLCASTGRQFLHAGLVAPGPVLQARRKEREGDDKPVGPVPVPDPQDEYDCMVFDTGVERAATIADGIVKRIVSNQECEGDG